jgi:hypothetical protein
MIAKFPSHACDGCTSRNRAETQRPTSLAEDVGLFSGCFNSERRPPKFGAASLLHLSDCRRRRPIAGRCPNAGCRFRRCQIACCDHSYRWSCFPADCLGSPAGCVGLCHPSAAAKGPGCCGNPCRDFVSLECSPLNCSCCKPRCTSYAYVTLAVRLGCLFFMQRLSNFALKIDAFNLP